MLGQVVLFDDFRSRVVCLVVLGQNVVCLVALGQVVSFLVMLGQEVVSRRCLFGGFGSKFCLCWVKR